MAVSGQHERLVGRLIRWVEEHHLTSGDVCLYADHHDWPNQHKPTQMNGFVPDLYAVGVGRPLTIIGEAETISGIESPHTKVQFEAFIEFLHARENPLLLVAVPWSAVPAARGLVRNIFRRQGKPPFQTVFLDLLE